MTNLVTITGLSKNYAGVHAINDVSMEIATGEVHALCGENGAGKSTLIKCLSGVTAPDSGTVQIDGSTLRFGDVATSERAGIAVIHQESTTFQDLNTVDNIFVGREVKNRFGLLNHTRMREEAQQLMSKLGEDINILRPLSELPLANRQIVSMARSLSQQCRLLIMDEPTASLSSRETEMLMLTVRRLRNQGVSILYVSHRLGEIFELADRVTVLRDGRHIETCAIPEITERRLIRMMVGRDTQAIQRRRTRDFGSTQLEVIKLNGDAFADISLSVRSGEIVGLAGLVGAGRSELARAVVGLGRYWSGEVRVGGKRLPADSVQASLERGLVLVPEDRQHEGLMLPMTVTENMTMAVLPRLTRRGMVDRNKERLLVADLAKRLDVKAASVHVSAESLSGGNQQKLVLSKWLATEPSVLILDEPTRGVDVNAKSQVHQLIGDLATKGLATFIISSELPELMAICDRILVMREGRISGEVNAETATQEQILQLALPDSSILNA
ncbi:MAG: sugar ABC transporter ATP-binding protein [Pirellulaceae bacterium]|jgi:rhamnose transport system ATP-binding protein|nr:sugar ABC transporter ATP-binding protein [Pirellulaceae bacterium]